MKEFFLSYWIHVLTVIVLAVITLIVYINIRKRKKRKKEENTAALIDEMSIRRASIDTTYLEKDFFKTVEGLVYSYYSQQPQLIPADKLTGELYTEWYERLKREYDLKIQKQVINFEMSNSRIVKIDNSAMYGVARIEAEAEFSVEYVYSHVTLSERRTKDFRQRFSFLNANNVWMLEKALPEEAIKT